jgi:hypothetical protein
VLKKFFYGLMFFALVFSFLPKTTQAALLPWEAVVDATHGGGAGFGDSHNAQVNSMATFNGYVYAATYNSGANPTGTQVWRSPDGVSWTQTGTDVFSPSVAGSVTLTTFNNKLYAFVGLGIAAGVVVFESSDGVTWGAPKKIDVAGDHQTFPYPLVATTYNGYIYIGFENDADEAVVYSSNDGVTWTLKNVPDFGVATNTFIEAMAVEGNNLYVGVRNDTTGAQVWTYDGANWAQNNTSGFDGINNHNRAVGGLVVFNNMLYATTENADGAQVWRSSGNGIWEKVSTGFSAATNGYGGIVFRNYLYLASQTGKVFRSSSGTSWEQVNVDAFGQDDVDYLTFAILGDYLYAGGGSLEAQNTAKIYRYFEAAPTVESLPQTGADL